MQNTDRMVGLWRLIRSWCQRVITDAEHANLNIKCINNIEREASLPRVDFCISPVICFCLSSVCRYSNSVMSNGFWVAPPIGVLFDSTIEYHLSWFCMLLLNNSFFNLWSLPKACTPRPKPRFDASDSLLRLLSAVLIREAAYQPKQHWRASSCTKFDWEQATAYAPSSPTWRKPASWLKYWYRSGWDDRALYRAVWVHLGLFVSRLPMK